MFRYTKMAEEIREGFKGGDIDGYISKYASANKLNISQQQRIVEEVNVGTFLDKLKDGTHHEDFPIAEAVHANFAERDDSLNKTASEYGRSPLEKVASVEMSSLVTSDMYNIGTVEFDDSIAADTLSKTAGMYDENLEAASNEWEKNDDLAKEASIQRVANSDTVQSWEEWDKGIDFLTKIASESEGMAKAVIATMSKMNLEKEAVDMLENIKYSNEEIINSNTEELSFDTIHELRKLAGVGQDALDIGKNVYDATKSTGKAAWGLAKMPVKNPKTAAATGLSALAIKNMNNNMQADEEALRMSAYASGGSR